MFVTIKMALTGVACPDAGKIACVWVDVRLLLIDNNMKNFLNIII